MKRRNFIKTTATTAVALPIVLNGFPVGAISNSSLFQGIDPDSDRVLVLIQLNGGNDGLNMLFPTDQYDKLANVRQNMIIPESKLLKINDLNSLHPSMTGIRDMYDNAKVSFVQSVGYPEQNRSHFRSMDIWHTASESNEYLDSGWMGRYLDQVAPGYPSEYPNNDFPDPIAITIGPIVSETCQGQAANFSMAIEDPSNLSQLATGGSDVVPNTPYGDELTFLRETIQQSNAYASIVEDASNNGTNSSNMYDITNRLAVQLRTVARLISGGLRTKVYVVSLGGFDTHANQVVDGEPETGTHAALLSSLSNAIASFQDDLNQQGLEKRVVGMTYSEFGRQIASNFSSGTDHGTAAPMMFFGDCVNAGIFGDNPEIPDQVEPQEGVPMQFDFRSMYGSMLMDWFDVEEAKVKSLLYDDFKYVPVLQPCISVGTNDRQHYFSDSLELVLSPNPFRNTFYAEFETKNEWVRISLINSLGQELRVVNSAQYNAGKQRIPVEAHGLPSGNYYLRVQMQDRQRTKMVVKL